MGVNTKFLSWQFHIDWWFFFLYTETLLKIKAFEFIHLIVTIWLVICVTTYELIEIKWTLSTYEYVFHTFFFAVSFDSFCTISCARVTIFKMYPWKEIFRKNIYIKCYGYYSHHRDQRLITVFVYADLQHDSFVLTSTLSFQFIYSWLSQKEHTTQ